MAALFRILELYLAIMHLILLDQRADRKMVMENRDKRYEVRVEANKARET